MSELIGKKKKIIDATSYATLPIDSESPDTVDLIKQYHSRQLYGMKFLGTTAPATDMTEQPDMQTMIEQLPDAGKNVTEHLNLTGKDLLRVATGNYWKKNEGTQVFSNDQKPVGVFYSSPVILEYCNPDQIKEIPGLGPLANHATIGTEEKMSIYTQFSKTSHLKNYTSLEKPNIQLWTYFLKTGYYLKDGSKVDPLLKTNTPFFDHYHETSLPFSKKELLIKKPAGPFYFAEAETYYNERLNSQYFETVIGNRGYVQNSLPSVYSFLRLLGNEDISKGSSFSLTELFNYMSEFFEPADDFFDALAMVTNMYVQLLQAYPLETVATLYGQISKDGSNTEKVIENLVTFNKKIHDVSGLYERYVNDGYASLVANSPEFAHVGIAEEEISERLMALERIMTNLCFSPNVIKTMDKIEKYKKDFPFYCELTFKAKLNTEIGDLMKKSLLTRFMSEKLSAGFERAAHTGGGLLALAGTSGSPSAMDSETKIKQNDSLSLPFVDYYIENVYDNLANFEVVSKQEGQVVSTGNDKKLLDLIEVFGGPDENTPGYIKKKNYMGSHEPLANDIRNFTTFLRNNLTEPAQLDSDENQFWKLLLGSNFYSKILQTYKKHKRSYKDILEGKPAYTEDLFYRIKKLRKNIVDGTPETDYKFVQSILIPNTSELDIVKYVDTQMKYSSDAIYKYEIYAERVVFGSQYIYYWTTPGDNIVEGEHPIFEAPSYDNIYDNIEVNTQSFLVSGVSTPMADILVDEPDGLTQTPVPKMHAASFKVRVQPSIKIMEDLLFTTPDIMIMDKPPVAPNVDIVPFRGVNNRVKILLDGLSDRYRDSPVLMTEQDGKKFSDVLKAQMSLDGKVEFGSDDIVKSFEVFRSTTPPQQYSDFSRHPTNPLLNNNVLDDKILPNTKYYYTFRAIDAHGHVSNPTAVYQVELIDEKGAVKPNIRLFNMIPPESDNTIKHFRKYLRIIPSAQQLYDPGDGQVDSVFSTQQKKKKFKMRITSRSSGKKIDVNFSFHKKIETEET